PAALVANRIDDGQTDDVLEPEQRAHDRDTRRPRAGERDIQMVTTGNGGIAARTVSGNPGAKGVFLTLKIAVDLLGLKLRAGVHGAQVPAFVEILNRYRPR